MSLVARHARDGVHAMTELPGLLGAHQVVVLAVPLTSQTRGLVDAAFLAAAISAVVEFGAAETSCGVSHVPASSAFIFMSPI